jgi:glycosyltransferase involved in cell wall biosynthesis
VTPDDHPRVLFVTPHAFNHQTGGGVTFTNLFRGWPKAALATVHNDPIPTTDDVCDRYYCLGRAELDVWRPIRLAADAMGIGGVRDVTTAPSSGASTSKSPAPPPGWMRRARAALGAGELPRQAALSPALEAWIADFQPEVLYTILGGNGFMDLVEAIRRRFDLPMVAHMMDDWPSVAHRKGILAPAQRRGTERRLRAAMAVAARRLSICDAMSDAFAARYGAPFQAIQNAVDITLWRALARTDSAASPNGDLLYVGSIMPHAQLGALIECCAAVARLRQSGRAVTLTIAAPEFQISSVRPLLEIDPAIIIAPPITDDAAFFRRIAAADALLLPVNFDADSVAFIRHSMPTKVPAYLFSGTPILVYGPAEVAQTRYAREASWGLVVDQPDKDTLAHGIARILDDGVLRERLRVTAQHLAAERHDIARVGAEFRTVLTEAARVRTQQ